MDVIEQFQNRFPSPIYHQAKCSNNSTVTVVPVPTFGNFGSSTSTINMLTTTQTSPAISPSPFVNTNLFSTFKRALLRSDSQLLTEFGTTLFRLAQSRNLNFLNNFEESSLDGLFQRLEYNLETSTNKFDETFKRENIGETLQNTVKPGT